MSILQFLFRGKKPARPALKPRGATRLAMSEPVRLKLPDGVEQPAILQDVSSGGAALRTHQRMHIGEHIGLSMYLGIDQRYELQAQVVYARQGNQGFHARYGVRFVAMSDEERFRLDTYVKDCIEASIVGVRGFAHTNQFH